MRVQLAEQVGEIMLVIFPSADRAVVDGLADLVGTEGADGALIFLEIKAGILPIQATGGDKTAGVRFQIGHEVLVLDFVKRDRQDLPPMVHETRVILDAAEEMRGIVVPGGIAEVGHPTGDGSVAKITTAMNESGVGDKSGENAKSEIVIGELIDDARVVGQAKGT